MMWLSLTHKNIFHKNAFKDFFFHLHFMIVSHFFFCLFVWKELTMLEQSNSYIIFFFFNFLLFYHSFGLLCFFNITCHNYSILHSFLIIVRLKRVWYRQPDIGALSFNLKLTVPMLLQYFITYINRYYALNFEIFLLGFSPLTLHKKNKILVI